MISLSIADLALHHIGIGVLDLEAGIEAYGLLGYTKLVAVDDERLGVRVAFLSPPQAPGHLIELLSPLGETSPLQSLIARKLLPGPYHTCYATTDYAVADRVLMERGFTRISKPTPALAMDQALIAFFYHHAIGLLEIVENPPFAPGNAETLRKRSAAIV
jgi:methylmalonyl-CoA/ethylmalonyl-CoA epimerase